jgi:hypothetical protein
MTTAAETRLPLDWVTITFLGAIHLGALVAFVPGMTNWSAIGDDAGAALGDRRVGHYLGISPFGDPSQFSNPQMVGVFF